MKKTLSSKKFRKIAIISIILVAAISVDFMMPHLAETFVSYRPESDFDVISAATVKVGIVPSDYSELANPQPRSSDLSYAQVEDMVRKAIELQGGLDWVVSKGDDVMIKVNLVGKDSPSGQGENTDVRVVKALMVILHEFTEGEVTIKVAEGTARTNDDPNSTSSVWANSGYRDLLTDSDLKDVNFELFNLNQSISDLEEIDLGDKGMSSIQGTKYHVHRAELEADVYITVPVLKIHDTGITNALKLQVGTAPGCYYGYNKMKGTTYSPGIYHDMGHRRWTSEMIVDLCNIADIDFVVVDALMCLESYKAYNGSNQVRMNTIIAGVDPVAVDHICTKMMGLNPDDIAHITLAEKVGLGTNDPEHITPVGASLYDVMKKVKKNTSENGKFGQSNRTWILSDAFEGTDITTEYIENEASLKPAPGENGWSEPMYFFDDRIELLEYYNNKTNMVSYAYTYVFSPKAQVAELWLGSHEAIYVYLNGELAYSRTSATSYGDGDIGENVADINLKAGENSLLVKTLNKYGDYTFALNICEPESNEQYFGNRVKGLKFYQGESSGPGTKISNTENNIDVSCYPNPASETINFNFNNLQKSKATVKIFDIQGKCLKTFEVNNNGSVNLQWDLLANGNKIPAGTYVCTIRDGNNFQSTKFQVRN